MRARPLGIGAWLLDGLPRDPAALARDLRAAGWDAIAAYDSLAVYSADLARIESAIQGLAILPASPPAHHVIPICYDLGDDLAHVCVELGIAESDFPEVHSAVEYRCAAVGFSPGFGYLTGLPARLQGLARRSSPRTGVPAGSLAITGAQCAVYPESTPGGWNLVGRCPLTLVDVSDRYFPIAAGDIVRFRPISHGEYASLRGERL